MLSAQNQINDIIVKINVVTLSEAFWDTLWTTVSF